LHAVIPRIRYVHFPSGIDGDAHRFIQLSLGKSALAKLGKVVTLAIEDDHALLACVGHEHVPLRIHSYATWTPEAIDHTLHLPLAPHAHEGTLWRENLYAVVPGIGYVNQAIMSYRHTPRFVECAFWGRSFEDIGIAAPGVEV